MPHRVGADDVVRADDPADAGWPDSVDVAVEASGVAAGLDTCLRLVRRGGVVVQLGMLPLGQTPFAGNLVVSRKIELRGAFGFADEFDEALTLPTREPAFAPAADRRRTTAPAAAGPSPSPAPPRPAPAAFAATTTGHPMRSALVTRRGRRAGGSFPYS